VQLLRIYVCVSVWDVWRVAVEPRGVLVQRFGSGSGSCSKNSSLS
jgi:hypothetical protein